MKQTTARIQFTVKDRHANGSPPARIALERQDGDVPGEVVLWLRSDCTDKDAQELAGQLSEMVDRMTCS